jgi:hypothetical protein
MKLHFLFLLLVSSLPALAAEDAVEASLKKLAELSEKMKGDAPKPPASHAVTTTGYSYNPNEEVKFVARTNAERCSTKNFKDRFGEVRNQDGLGWCFAYAASDLLAFYTGKSPSAFALSLRYFQRTDLSGKELVELLNSGEAISSVGGGNIGGALQLAMQEGYCLESAVPSTDYVQSYMARLSKDNPLQKELEAFVQRGRYEWLANAVLKIEDFHKQKMDLVKDPAATCQVAQVANFLYPTLDMPSILAAMKSGKTKVELFNWLTHLACSEKEKVPAGLKASGMYAGKDKGAKLLPKIDELMDRGEPSLITYNPNPFWIDENAPADAPEDDSLHGSLLVGREFRDGKCQYLVRNTWGPSCSGYQRPCERGHFWMTEEDIAKHSFQLEFVEKP